MRPRIFIPLVLATVIGLGARVNAQEQLDTTELAKKTQNPVSDLVSIPLQFNWNQGGGFADATHFNLNLQPVAPIKFEKFTLTARTIVPYNSFPAGGSERATGIGDIQEQIYFAPANPGKFIWGVGPVFSFPTATNSFVETGSWTIGPGAVALTTPGPWVIGALVNQYWTYYDEGGDPETNLFVFQPFVNYNFGGGWALAFAPLWTANWDAPDGDEWTIPLGLGLSRTTVFNRRPMVLGVQFYRNVEHPSGGADTQIRAIVSFLYPK
ncbi:MAG: neuromedin U [Candidatus Latescibacteria bacterium]|nr:neuromedin U [Candidatus Latescibacterota bacterium]